MTDRHVYMLLSGAFYVAFICIPSARVVDWAIALVMATIMYFAASNAK